MRILISTSLLYCLQASRKSILQEGIYHNLQKVVYAWADFVNGMLHAWAKAAWHPTETNRPSYIVAAHTAWELSKVSGYKRSLFFWRVSKITVKWLHSTISPCNEIFNFKRFCPRVQTPKRQKNFPNLNSAGNYWYPKRSVPSRSSASSLYNGNHSII